MSHTSGATIIDTATAPALLQNSVAAASGRVRVDDHPPLGDFIRQDVAGRRLVGKTRKVGFDGSGVLWDGLATRGTLEIVRDRQQRLSGLALKSPMTHRESNVRRKIQTTLSEHREAFALADLARTRDGYVLKFSRGMVMLVRSCPMAVLDDDAQLAALLARVHRDFDVVDPSRPLGQLAQRRQRGILS